MFRDSLLENSLTHRKRWPVLLAFMLEVLAGAAIVAVPLLSSGVIPVSAHTGIYCPLPADDTPPPSPRGHLTGTDGTSPGPATAIVTIANMHPTLTSGDATPENTRPGNIVSVPPGTTSSNNVLAVGGGCDHCSAVTSEPVKRVRVSLISPGQLIHRVEPVYPHIAILTHQGGEVKLHAIIARDGSIEDLSATSGAPLLVAAAMDAVKQWRYRPFLLNGQPVEVETIITVNFRHSGD